MAKMYSVATKEWRDIPEGDVQSAYSSGEYVFSKSERVPVALSDGRYGTILGSEFGEAARAGASYDLPSERQNRVEEAEYGGKNLEALLLAGGRGLTFGLSDVALEKMGAYSDEELENIEEHNAVLSGIGEVGGMLLPAVLTGGGSAAASVGLKGAAKAAIAASPAGFAFRSGAAAEKGVAALLGVEGAVGGSRMLRAVPGLAAMGGVEGALFGAGETISEEMLGRTDKTAEQIMGDIGSAALLGGVLTGAFSAVPALVAKAFQSQAKMKYPTGLAKKVADFKDKYTSAMTGVDVGLLAKTRDPKFLDNYLGYDEARDKLSTASTKHLGKMFDTAEEATRSVTAEKYRVLLPRVKPPSEADTVNGAFDAINTYIKSVEDTIPRLGDPTQVTAANNLIDAAKKARQELFEAVDSKLAAYSDDPIRAFKTRLTDEGTIEIDNRRINFSDSPELTAARNDFEELENMLKGMEGRGQKGTKAYQELEEEIVDFEKYLLNKESENAFAKGPDVYNPSTALGVPRTLKSKGGPVYDTAPLGQYGLGKLLDGSAKDAFRIVDQLKIQQGRYDKGLAGYTNLKKFLENKAFFGKAADDQKLLNASWSDLIGTGKNFTGRFMSKNKAAKPGEPSHVADSGKIDTFINQLHKMENKQHTQTQMFDAYLDAFDGYVTSAKAVGLNLGKAAPDIVDASRSLRKEWTDFKFLQSAKKELDSLSNRPGVISETFATVGGYAFGGLPGALAARYIRNIASPGDAVRRRVMAHRMKSTVTKQIDNWANNSTARLMGNKSVPFSELKGSKRASLLGLIGAKATGNPEEDTVKEMEALATISSPAALAEKVEQGLESLHDAPNLTAEMTRKTVENVALLQKAAQKNSTVRISQITGKQTIVISDQEAANYSRAQNAIMGKAVEQLAIEIGSGALTNDTVANTWAAYPILTAQFVQKFGENLAEESEKTGKDIPFAGKQIWGKLNGTAVVPHQVAGAMQAVYKAMEQRQPKQNSRGLSGLRKVANQGVLPVEKSMNT